MGWFLVAVGAWYGVAYWSWSVNFYFCSMKTEKQNLNALYIMRSNIRLLVFGWCSMWGILGTIFTALWLWRYLS